MMIKIILVKSNKQLNKILRKYYFLDFKHNQYTRTLKDFIKLTHS